jgi:hypothetical protein
LEKRTSINSHSVFHKEKEMADFRKWLFAFALVALLLGAGTANAQNPTQAFTCVANAGNPVIVRSEGIAELVGDLLLQCTGGVPTSAGTQIPVSNVTLTLNTNITSRLLGSGFIDALLLIDEPWPASGVGNELVSGGTVAAPALSPVQKVCFSNGTPTSTTVCNYLPGTGISANGNGAGQANSPYLPGNVAADNGGPYTVYVAHTGQGLNQVTWLGVPIDAPGSTGNRIIRITNVRGNACQLGLSSTLIPTQIVAFIAINGSQFITISNPQQTLAYIQQGLVVGGTTGGASQCSDLNLGFFQSSGGQNAEFAVTVKEGFAASFKRQTWTGVTSITPLANGLTSVAQNVPGYAYNTESGFAPDLAGESGGSTSNFGAATQATRILVRFNNIATGVRLFLPTLVPLVTGTPNPPSDGLGGYTGGFLQLIGSSSDASGNILTIQPTGSTSFLGFNPGISNPFKGPGLVAPFDAASEITSVGGVATAVYEVVNADPAAVESASIAVGVGFVSNTAQNLPLAPSNLSAHVSFAPLSTVNTWDGSAPIPRFCDQSADVNRFPITICQCQLLFPFVTQAPGFDTGIAIANTSMDTYNGVTPQTGNVTLWFYGQEEGGAAVPTTLASMTTTSPVPAGQVLTYTTFSGGGAFGAGLQANPGFTGYVIAVANFQWCHGFAFISDLGAQKLAEGYLAIQLDLGGLSRTNNLSEQKAH